MMEKQQEHKMLTELKVRGMHCMSCKNLIEEDLAELPGVATISVDLAGERAQIDYDPTQIELTTLINKISELGYQAEAV
jgi:copper chaperone CopZ